MSHWQEGLTADIVKQWGAAGGVVKLGGGNSGVYESSTHREQVAAFRGAGVPASRYWFNGRDNSIASQVDAVKRALQALPLAADEFLMWDVETEGDTPRWSPDEVAEAVQSVGLPGSLQWVYLSASATRSVDWSPVVQLGVDLVVADYGRNDGTPSGMPLVGCWPRTAVRLWQYTDQGRLPGYDGNLDLNTTDLRRVWTVAELQTALNNKTGAGLVADGIYGPATTTAVKAFQAVCGLTVDGIAGVETLTKLGAV